MLKDDIRACRKAAGLTQQALAERLGISMMTVSSWERGAHAPEPTTCARIAEALDAEYRPPRIVARA